nr:hypothetical protein CFP56_66044 [Quercus suber]
MVQRKLQKCNSDAPNFYILARQLEEKLPKMTWSYGRWCRGPSGTQGIVSILSRSKAFPVIFCMERRPCCRRNRDSAEHPLAPECAPTSLRDIEELSTRWKKLTLSDSEENRIALRANRKKRDFVLARKFFTRRTLNVEAITKTFRPLWRTKGGFNVTVGENILLFAFKLEVDAERVFQGEPWAFDRHLVVFENFDGYTPIHTLGFKTTTFWVQIHNLPFLLQTVEIAFSIGETIGHVIKSKDLEKMLGANFMRVRVVVDVSKPLCRGRKIYWDEENEGWAAFMAPLFNPAKKSFVEVKGYEVRNQGVDGVMVSSNTQTVKGIMKDNEYVSSSVKLLTRLLRAEKDDIREVPSIEEQLHVSDQGINSTPMFSNLKPENSGIASATIPKFYHAITCTNVTKEN